MKLILSRKGFDSSPQYGACASPILPDGRMVSLPIPHASGTTTFGELGYVRLDVGQLVSDLTGGKLTGAERAHLDPDLDPAVRPRRRGWRAAFGQAGAAQRHLERQGVGVGDLFLFFGWFRRVEKSGECYRYRDAPSGAHVIFGWLRVGHVLRVGLDDLPDWLGDHPHAGRDWAHNTIYVGEPSGGGGSFERFHPCLQLTDPAATRRSIWRLPSDFLPGSRPPLTYHGDARRWVDDGDSCRLQSVAKGQEFVLDLADYPRVRQWAGDTIRGGSSSSPASAPVFTARRAGRSPRRSPAGLP
ncbi:MAG TPA: hypothetical protein VFK57_08580 [Vicinamibacterales bacterium]|nr:hypothetical protein [Vicinamibacterales bacterium]